MVVMEEVVELADDQGVFLHDISFFLYFFVRSVSDWARKRILTLNVLLTKTSKPSRCSHS